MNEMKELFKSISKEIFKSFDVYNRFIMVKDTVLLRALVFFSSGDFSIEYSFSAHII